LILQWDVTLKIWFRLIFDWGVMVERINGIIYSVNELFSLGGQGFSSSLDADITLPDLSRTGRVEDARIQSPWGQSPRAAAVRRLGPSLKFE